jgi:fructose transport system substrate-binding protein
MRTIRARRIRMRVVAWALATVCAAGLAACGSSGSVGTGSSTAAPSQDVTIGVVELNLTNPFFVSLKNATERAAKANGWKVITAEAKAPGDYATQVTAVENMINNKVDAIVLTPAHSTALVPVVQKARDAGIPVVTINGTLKPTDAADATYATDNFAAGKLIGRWAKGQKISDPHIAMLDFDLSDGPSRGRHDGFLAGYGITDDSPLIVGRALTGGTVDTGQIAMEDLLAAHPDINLLYTINEPTARGAYTAIADKGLAGKVTVVSVDGACAGVRNVKAGIIGATVMQYPSRMGTMAVDAIAAFVQDGTKPSGVVDSGTTLITDKPINGLPSKTSTWGLDHCWGP